MRELAISPTPFLRDAPVAIPHSGRTKGERFYARIANNNRLSLKGAIAEYNGRIDQNLEILAAVPPANSPNGGTPAKRNGYNCDLWKEGELYRRLTLLSVLTVAAICWTFWHINGLGSSLSRSLKRTEAATSSRERVSTQGRLVGTNQASIAALPRREILRRIRELRREQHRSDESLYELVALELTIGRVGEAISLLEDARKSKPDDIAIWINLSAAYLTRGQNSSETDLRDTALALSLADGAAARDQLSPEARFNQALALERLSLFPWARTAWHKYSQLDMDSDWAAVAQEHLENIQEIDAGRSWLTDLSLLKRSIAIGDNESGLTVVRRSPDLVRKHVEEQSFGRWAESSLTGKSQEGLAALSEIRTLGRMLSEATGDAMVLDSVRAIDLALSRGDETANLLAKGHQAFQEGLRLYLGDHVEMSIPRFEEAATLLGRADSPFSRWASLYLAITEYSRSDFGKALDALDYLQSADDLSRYPSLAARINWLIGMCKLSLGEPTESMRAYMKALRLLEQTRAAADIGFIHHLLAENFRYLGDENRAWSHRGKALSLVPKISESRRLYAIFDETANATSKLDLPRAELYFRKAVLKIALQEPDPRGVAFAFIRRALTYDRLDEKDKAVNDLVKARQLCIHIKDKSAQEYMEARLGIVEGEILFSEDQAKSLDTLGRAIDYYHRTGNRYPLTSLYWAQAARLRALNRHEEEKEALVKAVQEFERQRIYLSDEERISYFTQAREAFDRLVSLEVERGELENAFSYMERARARVLLDKLLPSRFLGPRLTEPRSVTFSFSLKEFRQRIPEGVKFLEYVVLSDRLLVWVISREELQLVNCPVSELDLEKWIRNLDASWEQDPSGSMALLKKLRREVILPIIPHIKRGDLLVIVPDKMLYSLPFAALADSKGKFLIEDFPLVISPSASIYLEALRRRKTNTERNPSRVLIVANPKVESLRYRDLTELKMAEREASEIASLYGVAEVQILGREKATREAFLASAIKQDIIHFSGHSVPNPNFPALSYLAMASNSGDMDALYSFELASLDLSSVRLVILASCHSGTGHISSSEGVMSIGRAFINAGVPSVVVSLRPINDSAAELFFSNFHRYLVLGANPASALRSAQLIALQECRGESQCVREWSAFQVIGVVEPRGSL